MEPISITAISVVGTYIMKETLRFVKYKKEKNKIKRNLIMAFNHKNKNNIKKYIGYIKDFDKKYQTEKAQKYLDKIIRHNRKLNEENVLSLLQDYTMIDNIYDTKILLEHMLDKRMDNKLDMMERMRKETILRQNQNKHRLAIKQQKMNKNKVNKKSAMG